MTTAKAWGLRPSSMLGERDEVVAFALDEALATVHAIAERRAAESATKHSEAPPEDPSIDVWEADRGPVA